MKIATCHLTTGIPEYEPPPILFQKLHEYVLIQGKQLELPEGIVPLEWEDPVLEQKYILEPSYLVNECLVSVRRWYDIWSDPCVSVIIVGPFDKVSEIRKQIDSLSLATRCHQNDLEKKANRDYFVTFDLHDETEWQSLKEKNYYAELLAKDLIDEKI